MTKVVVPQCLQEIAERKHWHVAQLWQGPWYAWRVIELWDQTFNLRIIPNKNDLSSQTGWLAIARSSDALGYAAEYSGTREEVLAEIWQTEKALDLIQTLRECRSRAQATALVADLRGRNLELVRMALDIRRGPVELIRRRIVEHMCGFCWTGECS